MIRHDLHVHTLASDGACDFLTLARGAADQGIRAIGFSDHLATLKLGDPPAGIMPGHIDAHVKAMRAAALKVKDRVLVLAGIEVDFNLLRTDFFSFLVRHQKAVASLDYLLFEYVSDPAWDGMGIEELARLRPHIPTAVGLAHPDLERCFGPAGYQRLADILEQHDIFVDVCCATRHVRGGLDPKAAGTGMLPDDERRLALHREQYMEASRLLDKERDPKRRRELTVFRDKLRAKVEALTGDVPRPTYEHAGRFFELIRGRNIRVAAGSDCHDRPEALSSSQAACEFITRMGLDQQLLVARWLPAPVPGQPPDTQCT